MQIPRNEFTRKFQGTLQMGQKVIIRFWWESGLLSAYRNYHHICRPLVHCPCLRLCFAIVHFIRNNCVYFVWYGWLAQALTELAALPISVAYELKNSSCNIDVSARKKEN